MEKEKLDELYKKGLLLDPDNISEYLKKFDKSDERAKINEKFWNEYSINNQHYFVIFCVSDWCWVNFYHGKNIRKTLFRNKIIQKIYLLV